MRDHFAALEQPRRPCVDIEALKERFHRDSATHHPDVAGTGDANRFAEINAAYTVLRDPVWRLRHLLELEAPEALSKPHEIPTALGELFPRMASVRAALDAFAKKQTAAANPLARALLIPERLEIVRRCEEACAELDAAHEESLAAIVTLDGEWEMRNASTFDRLAALQQRLAYLSKWRAQFRETLLKVSE